MIWHTKYNINLQCYPTPTPTRAPPPLLREDHAPCFTRIPRPSPTTMAHRSASPAGLAAVLLAVLLAVAATAEVTRGMPTVRTTAAIHQASDNPNIQIVGRTSSAVIAGSSAVTFDHPGVTVTLRCVNMAWINVTMASTGTTPNVYMVFVDEKLQKGTSAIFNATFDTSLWRPGEKTEVTLSSGMDTSVPHDIVRRNACSYMSCSSVLAPASVPCITPRTRL